MTSRDNVTYYDKGLHFAWLPRISHLSKDIIWFKKAFVVNIDHTWKLHNGSIYTATQTVYLTHEDYVFMGLKYNLIED